MKLYNDDAIVGADETALEEALREMDSRFTVKKYEPYNFNIWTLVQVRENFDLTDFWFAKLEPEALRFSGLFPSKSNYFANGDHFVKCSKEWMKENGLLEYADQIKKIGFMLEYYDEEESFFIVPDDELPATLYKVLGIGGGKEKDNMEIGPDPFRDLYVASLCGRLNPDDKNKMTGISFRTSTGVHIGYAFFTYYYRGQQVETLELMQKLREQGHDVSVRQFSVSPKLTSVDLVFNEMTSDDVPFEYGVRYRFSDIGNCSYTIKDMLYWDGGSAELGVVNSYKHTKGYQYKDIVSEYASAPGFISATKARIEAMPHESLSAEEAQAEFEAELERINFCKAVGKKRFGEIIEAPRFADGDHHSRYTVMREILNIGNDYTADNYLKPQVEKYLGYLMK